MNNFKSNRLIMAMGMTFLFAIIACSSGEISSTSNSDTAPLTGTVEVDGSSTVAPVSEAVAEEFKKQFPKTNVLVGVSGSGGGFKRFVIGETDISNASRDIKLSEAEKAKANGIDFAELESEWMDCLSWLIPKILL